MVCTYNEEDWVDLSLLSIRDLVNEYVVVDSSTDKTLDKVNEVRRRYGLPIKVVRIKAGDLVSARNIALKEAKYRWILHWDADFIATPKLVSKVKELLKTLNDNKCYLVYWKMIRLCGDPYHVCRNPYHVEHWLFTWSKELRYEWVDKYDSLIAPIYKYKVVFINEPLGFHLAYVRSPRRLIMKWIWWRFRSEADEFMRGGGTLEDFTKRKIKELFGMDDLTEAGKILISRMIRELPKYDESLCGELPREVVRRAIELGITR